MNSSFLGILANIFMSLLLYLYEKYSDNDGLNMIMSDANRMELRKNQFGGQPCSHGAMVTGHVIMFLTLSAFVVWHIIMIFWIYQAWGKRRKWRTLALPESVELSKRPLPSILTQFNGQDTAIAKANAALGKWAHRMHLDKMIKTNVDDGGSGEKSEGDDDSCSMEGVKSQASPYTLTNQTMEILKEHSMPQESVDTEKLN